MKIQIKYCLLSLLVVCISTSSAQTKIFISGTQFENSPIQLEYLNTPDLQGSSFHAGNNGGFNLSLDIVKSFGKNIDLKIGFSLGQFRENIHYNAIEEFQPDGFQDQYNPTLIQGLTDFGELSIGPSFSFNINEKSTIYFSLNAKVGYINKKDIVIDRGYFINGGFGSFEHKFLLGKLDYQNDNQMQLGLGSEILYEYSYQNLPISIHIGVVATYTPRPYLIGNINFIGSTDELNIKVIANHNYVGLKLGFSYTF